MNQASDWTLLLRHPLHRIRIACAVSHQDVGAAHPAAAIPLSVSSTNWTRRGTNVSLGWLSHQGSGAVGHAAAKTRWVRERDTDRSSNA